VEFHQTLVDDVVVGTCELIRFWRSTCQGQCHNKVVFLSELQYIMVLLRNIVLLLLKQLPVSGLW